MAEKAFSIAEIRLLIIDYIVDEEGEPHYSTLAKLARTSRLFFDTVVPILWKSCRLFSHILNLLPRKSDPSSRELVRKRYWSAWDIYAPHIQSLKFDGLNWHQGQEYAFAAAKRKRAAETWFPNLQHLEIKHEYTEDAPETHLLVTKSLKSLVYRCYNHYNKEYNDATLLNILERIFDQETSLTHLELGYFDEKVQHDALLRILSTMDFKFLSIAEDLESPKLQESILCMNNLTSLKIAVTEDITKVYEDFNGRNAEYLPHLKDLTLSARYVTSAQEALKQFQQPSLRQLTIGVDDCHTLYDIERGVPALLEDLVASTIPFETINIDIEFWYTESRNEEICERARNLISQVLLRPDLKTFILGKRTHHPFFPPYTKEWIMELAQGIPNCTELYMTLYQQQTEDGIELTVEEIATLCNRAPMLKNLQLHQLHLPEIDGYECGSLPLHENLQGLELMFINDEITDELISSFKHQFPKLTYLGEEIPADSAFFSTLDTRRQDGWKYQGDFHVVKL